ncbi:MAG: phospholipid carrier-dependent glycosyltransferase [Prolixibacteraceae bacterium]|jgi:4-amino-4-deoxy-L-arabinose transferase-like glycosyltransferase|nr:phospholipid carrier-dependent glycosyltransferase [Prolixibacteraceae bacterium]MBT6004538.1 phospholipid carrier-dependent glycosyltransferase [Prolixibacteraceae bacterium]MBT6998632.1 phospholipid carrier-dependent glycosyltransferase [Prolixibacteraceae bacterium]MBT7397433.1 phospholipid carrier-dependent glycosyltransferase [Prolixibacteraceae bacterium]
MQKPGFQKYCLIIIPILFLMYSAPSALDYVFHFPDEKYYTDAVLQMMEKGDYFTPYKADGSPRFLKPIATYWVLIGSYKIFGVSPFSSRLFFWLAGALLVIVTYLMGKSLSGNRKIATTAAFITAANPLVLMSASRSIPDILLVLFLTISAWGFLEILISEKPQKKFYWLAYLGAALAFETKGIPAAAFAGVSILYLLFNPWKRKKIKQLFEPVSLIVAVLIALSWFVIMYIEHGAVYLDSFFADQVGYRVSSKTIQVFTNTGLGIANLIAFLIPWIFIVFSKPKELKKYISKLDKSLKAIFGFILVWILLFILMSGAVFKFYDRYVLPVIPLVSIFMAYVFIETKITFKKTIVVIFLVLNVFILTINILYAAFILPDTILILGIMVAISILVKWGLGIFKNVSKEIIIANGIMLFYFNVFILLYPLLMPNPGKQLVSSLRENGISETDKVYVYGNIRAASNIRIHSKNFFNVISMDTVYTLPVEPNHFLVFDKKEQDMLDLKNYEIVKSSEEWLRVPIEKMPKLLQKSVSELKENGTKYYIAKPNLH